MTATTTLTRLRQETTIEERRPFHVGKYMIGQWVSSADYLNVSKGRLPHGTYTLALMNDIKASDCYVVFSYQTPIGWVRTDGGKWRIPPVTYSVSTARHQNIVKLAARHDGILKEEEWKDLITSTE
jgi:hypothetical protein